MPRKYSTKRYSRKSSRYQKRQKSYKSRSSRNVRSKNRKRTMYGGSSFSRKISDSLSRLREKLNRPSINERYTRFSRESDENLPQEDDFKLYTDTIRRRSKNDGFNNNVALSQPIMPEYTYFPNPSSYETLSNRSGGREMRGGSSVGFGSRHTTNFLQNRRF